MATDEIIVDCPTCGKPVRWHTANPWRPFCSERCRLIDLSEWMDESRRIPSDSEVPPSSEIDPNGIGSA